MLDYSVQEKIDYFKKAAKRITIGGIGLTGLVSGGYYASIWVNQYLNEVSRALARGELNSINAIPVICCFVPAVLGFGLAYRAMRIAKKSSPEDH